MTNGGIPATSTMPTEPADLGALLRTLRRAADLSQRGLAERAGVPQVTVARIESGAVTNPAFRTVERLVSAAGGRLAPGDGPAIPHEELRDEADRHYPAHLDITEVTSPEQWWGAWWTMTVAPSKWPLNEVPAVTFDLSRRRRDARRQRAARGLLATVRRSDLPSDGDEPTQQRWIWLAELAAGSRVGELRAHRHDGATGPVLPVPSGAVVIDGLVVAPGWRRLGIGRRLVAALRAGVGGSVVAMAPDLESQRFLASCGFEVFRGRVARWYVAASG